MDIEPTGIFVRVRDEKGHWVNIDIALLSAIQQKEFLSTVDEEKSFAWLPSIIMELCKKQVQNTELVEALQHLGSRPEGYCFCPREIPSGDHTGECREAQQALALVGDN